MPGFDQVAQQLFELPAPAGGSRLLGLEEPDIDLRRELPEERRPRFLAQAAGGGKDLPPRHLTAPGRGASEQRLELFEQSHRAPAVALALRLLELGEQPGPPPFGRRRVAGPAQELSQLGARLDQALGLPGSGPVPSCQVLEGYRFLRLAEPPLQVGGERPPPRPSLERGRNRSPRRAHSAVPSNPSFE